MPVNWAMHHLVKEKGAYVGVQSECVGAAEMIRLRPHRKGCPHSHIHMQSDPAYVAALCSGARLCTGAGAGGRRRRVL